MSLGKEPGLFHSATSIFHYLFARIVVALLGIAGLILGSSIVLRDSSPSAKFVLVYVFENPVRTIMPACLGLLYIVAVFVAETWLSGVDEGDDATVQPR